MINDIDSKNEIQDVDHKIDQKRVKYFLPEGALLLAPMAGYTDQPFRILCREYGCDLVFTEMISSAAICRGNEKTARMAELDQRERPSALQLFGSRPDELRDAARIIAEKFKPEVLDLNSGCPAPKIANNQAGVALMKDSSFFDEMVHALSEGAGTTPFSVKIRLGVNSKSFNAPELAAIAEKRGVSFISVHGRFGSQGYSGNVSMEGIREVVDSVKIPVVGNGDVRDEESYRKMKSLTGCHAVMIGRGTYGAPWLFSKIKGASVSQEDKKKAVLRALTLLQENMNDHSEDIIRKKQRIRKKFTGKNLERYVLDGFKKHLVQYFRGVPGAGAFRRQVFSVETFEEAFTMIEDAFQGENDGL